MHDRESNSLGAFPVYYGKASIKSGKAGLKIR
jgi:hypothetical protein